MTRPKLITWKTVILMVVSSEPEFFLIRPDRGCKLPPEETYKQLLG